MKKHAIETFATLGISPPAQSSGQSLEAASDGDILMVPRSTVAIIEAAMNHMGDILNGMDAVELEDEEKTLPAFEAVRTLLATTTQSSEQIDLSAAMTVHQKSEIMLNAAQAADNISEGASEEMSNAEVNALVFDFVAAALASQPPAPQASAQPAAVTDLSAAILAKAVPAFFKGDRVQVCNEHGHIYHAVVTKSETRWSADRVPFVMYKVRADGDKTDTVVIPNSIITKPAALAATMPSHPTAPEAWITDLNARKLANLRERGWLPVGTILFNDGDFALFDSSCRWLTTAQYQRLMHEQDGSLFAAAPSPLPGDTP